MLQIDEYFRLLGGSGCYPSFCDWHVPALLILTLDYQSSDHSQAGQLCFEYCVRRLISERMWEQTDGLPQRAVELVSKLEPRPRDTEWLIAEANDRYPMTYSAHEKAGWDAFLKQREKSSRKRA